MEDWKTISGIPLGLNRDCPSPSDLFMYLQMLSLTLRLDLDQEVTVGETWDSSVGSGAL